jgi:hypothetical protein
MIEMLPADAVRDARHLRLDTLAGRPGGACRPGPA